MTTFSSRLTDDAFSNLFNTHAGIALKGQADLNLSSSASMQPHLITSSNDRSQVSTLDQEASAGLTNSQ